MSLSKGYGLLSLPVDDKEYVIMAKKEGDLKWGFLLLSFGMRILLSGYKIN